MEPSMFDLPLGSGYSDLDPNMYPGVPAILAIPQPTFSTTVYSTAYGQTWLLLILLALLIYWAYEQ